MRGGKRLGAGRKANSGTYKEPTVALRVPVSMEGHLREALEQYKKGALMPVETVSSLKALTPILSPALSTCDLPLFSHRIEAGFPSPADDTLERKLDLNEHLIPHPSATFFVRVSGESMRYAGIQSGDLLVVDRSINPCHNHVVIAVLHGELTVKRLYRKDGIIRLVPDNPSYPVIDIPTETDLRIWGVVTSVIHEFV